MTRLHKTMVSSIFLGILISSISAKTYVSLGEIDLIKLLAPPPPQESQQTKQEISEILKFQETRNKETVAFAVADQDLDVFRFSTVLGPQFNKSAMPVAAAFFKDVVYNTGIIIDLRPNSRCCHRSRDVQE